MVFFVFFHSARLFSAKSSTRGWPPTSLIKARATVGIPTASIISLYRLGRAYNSPACSDFETKILSAHSENGTILELRFPEETFSNTRTGSNRVIQVAFRVSRPAFALSRRRLANPKEWRLKCDLRQRLLVSPSLSRSTARLRHHRVVNLLPPIAKLRPEVGPLLRPQQAAQLKVQAVQLTLRLPSPEGKAEARSQRPLTPVRYQQAVQLKVQAVLLTLPVPSPQGLTEARSQRLRTPWLNK